MKTQSRTFARFNFLFVLAALFLGVLSSCSDNAVSPGDSSEGIKLPKMTTLTNTHETFNLVWSGDTLKSFDGTQIRNGKYQKFQFSYSNKLLSGISSDGIYFAEVGNYQNDVPTIVRGLTTSYDSQKRPLVVGEGAAFKYRYEYDGVNLKKIFMTYASEPEEIIFEATGYDSKVNVYRSMPVASLQRIANRMYHNEFTEWYTNMPLATFSENNLTGFKLYDGGKVSATGTIEYTYHSSGLPQTMKTSLVYSNETLSYTHSFTYEAN